MRWRKVRTWSVARRISAAMALVFLSVALAWAASLKITERPVADQLDGTEILGIIQNGQDRQVTAAEVGALGGAAQGLGPNFALTGGNIITGATEAKPVQIRDPGGTNGWNIYYHSNGTPTMKCVIASVEGDCNPGVQLNAGKKYQLKDSNGNILFEADSSTGAVTGETVWDLDLVAVNPADGVASHIWNKDPLSTACTPVAATGANQTYGACTFTDADGDQGVQIARKIPSRIQGILDADVIWKTTGTGNARFQFQTKCYATNVAPDAAFNTASVLTAAAGTSGRPNIHTISAITITGCSANNILRIRFFRNRTEGSDTLNAALDVEKVVFRLR